MTELYTSLTGTTIYSMNANGCPMRLAVLRREIEGLIAALSILILAMRPRPISTVSVSLRGNGFVLPARPGRASFIRPLAYHQHYEDKQQTHCKGGDR